MSLLGVTLLAYACGSENAPATTAGSAFCAGFCRLAVRCDGATTSCPNDCVAQRPMLAQLSVDGAKRLGDCIANVSCSNAADDQAWQTSVQACWDEVRTQIEVTPKLRSFCAGYAAAWFECSSWFSTADCEGIYGMYSDATLDQLTECSKTSSCDNLDACAKGVLGS